jgi:hypothetical protein
MNPSHQTSEQESIQKIIEKEISEISNMVGIRQEILHLWIRHHNLDQDFSLISLIYMMKRYNLNPLIEEVSVLKNTDGTTHAFITIDGWTKIINQHPQYAGMSLRESTEEKEGIPVWMECCIYRNDRILPIVIKEYFDEVKTDHVSWKLSPKRMLRHRTIQQCARLAFSVSLPEFVPKSATIHCEKPVYSENKIDKNTSFTPSSRTEQLRRKLGISSDETISSPTKKELNPLQ